jgi:cobalt-zinc-cadmium efflux system membrane fusion protein
MTTTSTQNRSRLYNSLVCLLAIPFFAAACAGCGSGTSESESKMTSYTSSEQKADTAQTFQIRQDQLAHVQVVAVQRENLPRTLRLTGAVAYNAFQTSPVFSPIGGPVHEILATPGQIVSRGQPLLLVTSPDYSVARSAYIKARDTYELSDKLFNRAKDLYAHGAIAEADLQQAESAHAQAHADLESSSDALRALGLKDPEAVAKNPVQSTAEIPVIAPVAGEVVERLVGPGQLLQAGATQCFAISDTATVWVLVNVYQSDLAFVHQGQDVEISTDAYPETFHGKISYIAPALDATTRTLQARIVTQNPAKKLKKDMYVTATVGAAALQNVLTVPDDAVLRDTENEPFVYVQTAPTEFARRQVTLGESNQGRVQVKSGVKEGERVAGNGSLFLQFMNSLRH